MVPMPRTKRRIFLPVPEQIPYELSLRRFDDLDHAFRNTDLISKINLALKRNGTTRDRKETVHYISLYHSMLETMGSLRAKKIAHIGSAAGLFARFLQTKGATAIGVDINRGHQRIAAQVGKKEKLNLENPVVASATALPVREGSLDAVVSEHFLFAGYLNPKVEFDSVKEAARVLKRGGRLFISNSVEPILESEISKIAEAGFRIERYFKSTLVLVKE